MSEDRDEENRLVQARAERLVRVVAKTALLTPLTISLTCFAVSFWVGGSWILSASLGTITALQAWRLYCVRRKWGSL